MVVKGPKNFFYNWIMILALCVILIILTFSARVIYVLTVAKGNISKQCARTLIVLGSGGHTTEMIRQVVNLHSMSYNPRLYVVGAGDSSSIHKIKIAESHLRGQINTNYSVVQIPRSRKVGQSYISSFFTTIYSIITCIPIVFSFKPDLVLCNGPGTCVPLCLVAFFMNVFCMSYTRIVFIESICRVKTLSQSGKILLPLADKIIVQWLELKNKYPQTEYIGRLV